MNNMDIIHPITFPNLGTAEYGTSLAESFNKINDNFAILANKDFIKGDAGDSISIEDIDLTLLENKEWYDKLKIAVLKQVYDDVTIDNLDTKIKDLEVNGLNPFDWDKLIPNKTNLPGHLYLIYSNKVDGTKIEISSLHYVFLDARYLNITNNTNPENYAGKEDLSCIIDYVYNSETKSEEETESGELVAIKSFPTLYFDDIKNQFCWMFNNSKTGLPAQGPTGDTGKPGKVYLVKAKVLFRKLNVDRTKYEWAYRPNNNDGNCLITKVLIGSADNVSYTEIDKIDPEIKKDLIHSTALVLNDEEQLYMPGETPEEVGIEDSDKGNLNARVWLSQPIAYNAEKYLINASYLNCINTVISNDSLYNVLANIRSTRSTITSPTSVMKGLFVPENINDASGNPSMLSNIAGHIIFTDPDDNNSVHIRHIKGVKNTLEEDLNSNVGYINGSKLHLDYEGIKQITCTVEGKNAVATGFNTIASGKYSHTEGYETKTVADYSHAEGNSTQALEPSTHAEGVRTIAKGKRGSHAEGSQTITMGKSAHAEGNSSALFDINQPEITETLIEEQWSAAAENKFSMAYGENSHVEGLNNLAMGYNSHAEGYSNIIKGESAHTEGIGNVTLGQASHTEGSGTNTQSNSFAAHAEGKETNAYSTGSHAEGFKTKTTNDSLKVAVWSHAEGNLTESSGTGSHAEGYGTIASNNYSHAEGTQTQASGNSAHVEGYKSNATGMTSHAEGDQTNSYGPRSHAEGHLTTTGEINNTQLYAQHAEGTQTQAIGIGAHAEGSETHAIGFASHAEGQNTIATGKNSHTSGLGTKTLNEAEFASGKYNNSIESSVDQPGTLFTIGNGTEEMPSNAFEVMDDGNTNINGSLKISGKTEINNAITVDNPAGITVMNGGVTVGSIDNNGLNIGADNNFTVSTDGSINIGPDNFTVSGATGDVYTNGTLDVTGDTTLGKATIGGPLTINGKTEISGGSLGVGSNVTVGGSLGVGSNITVDGSISGSCLGLTDGINCHGLDVYGSTSLAGQVNEGTMTATYGDYSHAGGCGSESHGDFSHALGYYTLTHGSGEFACGRYNMSDPNGNQLFSIGNGEKIRTETGGFEEKRRNVFSVINSNYIFYNNAQILSETGGFLRKFVDYEGSGPCLGDPDPNAHDIHDLDYYYIDNVADNQTAGTQGYPSASYPQHGATFWYSEGISSPSLGNSLAQKLNVRFPTNYRGTTYSPDTILFSYGDVKYSSGIVVPEGSTLYCRIPYTRCFDIFENANGVSSFHMIVTILLHRYDMDSGKYTDTRYSNISMDLANNGELTFKFENDLRSKKLISFDILLQQAASDAQVTRLQTGSYNFIPNQTEWGTHNYAQDLDISGDEISKILNITNRYKFDESKLCYNGFVFSAKGSSSSSGRLCYLNENNFFIGLGKNCLKIDKVGIYISKDGGGHYTNLIDSI